MDIKSFISVEVTKNERTYHFYMPVGAPFGEAYDAAFEVLNSITEMAKQAVEKAKPQEDESVEKEAEVEVVDK